MSGTIVNPTRHIHPRRISQLNPASPAKRRISKGTIAEFTDQEIHSMTHDELERLVLAACVYELPYDPSSRLKNMDRETLERLAFLTRRCCRNQGY